jgi:hypothetical protein
VTNSPAGKALMDEINKAEGNYHQYLSKISNLQPMLFEECYVKSFEEIRLKFAQ